MEKACKKIRRLIKANAVHRKGFTLASLSSSEILEHAEREMRELQTAWADNQLEELADVFGCLIHFAIRRKFTAKQIEERLLEKLKLRFPNDA